MPLRPRQHELEDASRRAFETFLPDRLVYRSLSHDYGIDGEVEEFEDGSATGLRFYVQLKATDETDLDKALKVPVKLSSASYFRAQPIPLLMVRYVAATRTLYGRWFHRFDPYYEHVGDEWLIFHWDEDEHQLDEASVARLFDEATAVMKAKSSRLELPVGAAIVASGGDLSSAELELGVRAAAQRCPDLVQIVSAEDDHLLSLEINGSDISASVAGLGSTTLHLDEDLVPYEDVSDLGSELLACAALALARAGHADLAARIGVHFFADSWLAFLPPMSMELAEAMAYSARAAEALELAERLDDDEDDNLRLASFSFLLAALRNGRQLRKQEREQLVRAMEARIERRQDRGDTAGAAGEAVGLGNYYRSAGDFPAAIRSYERALELDSEYESREHLWLELAGSYFLAGRFLESAAAYERALETSEEPGLDVEARKADALMHAGRYAEASEIFIPICADETELGAWAATKAAALHWIISTTDIDAQDRNPERAAQVAGQFAERRLTEREVEALSAEIWELDAASPLGWFNLARDFLNQGDTEAGMYAYLTTAVMQEGDIEAWGNVVTLAINLGHNALAAAAIVTGARLNGEKFMVELACRARENFDDQEAREEFLSGINALLEGTKSSEPKPGFEIRFVSHGRPVESVHLPPPGGGRHQR